MIRFITLCIFTLLMTTSSAWAKNWEVRSENFILVTDDRQDSAEKLVSDLEEYRQVLLGLWVTDPSREIQPVRIYAFNKTKTFEQVT